ncbi:MAG: helix-turn-helix domain-containing protein, partial [Bacteroidales bacterium]
MNRHSLSGREFLDKATERTETSLNNPQFGVSELASAMGMSRSNLHRKIREYAGVSISQFIRNIRLKKAMQLLQETSLTISEIGWEVGFNNISYFIKCFREHYGHPPGEVGNREEKFSKEQTEKRNKFPYINKNWQSKIIFIAVLLIIALVLVKFIDYNNKRLRDELITEAGPPYLRFAILPFKNDSQDKTNAYFINGLMEAILLNLSNDEDLSVRSRTSVEKYRYTQLSIPEIAKELEVDYIIEGSGQKYGDNVTLNIQLIDAPTDRHLFARKYQKKIDGVNDFINLQEEIALSLVAQVKDYVNPENLTSVDYNYSHDYEAFKYYLRAREVVTVEIYTSSTFSDRLALDFKMKSLCKKALEIDPEFSLAMIDLGELYLRLNYKIEYSDNYLDSAFYYAQKAIELDPDNSGAYILLGKLYNYNAMYRKALEQFWHANEIDKKSNPFRNIGYTYTYMGKYCKGLECEYMSLDNQIKNKAPVHLWTLISLENYLKALGFMDQSKKYRNRILQKTNDSLRYYKSLISCHLYLGELDSAVLILNRYAPFESVENWELELADLYIFTGEYEKASAVTKEIQQSMYPNTPNLG